MSVTDYLDSDLYQDQWEPDVGEQCCASFPDCLHPGQRRCSHINVKYGAGMIGECQDCGEQVI